LISVFREGTGGGARRHDDAGTDPSDASCCL